MNIAYRLSALIRSSRKRATIAITSCLALAWPITTNAITVLTETGEQLPVSTVVMSSDTSLQLLEGDTGAVLSAPNGLPKGLSGIGLIFNGEQNLHDFWQLRFGINASSQSGDVRVAIELVTRADGYEGTSYWLQKPEHHTRLADMARQNHQISTPIHVNNFARRPGSRSNGSLLELAQITGINIVLIADETHTDAVTVNISDLEFFDRSPYADFSSDIATTDIAEVQATRIEDFTVGAESRMAVYISNHDSSWLDFVASLKNIGLPIKTHTVLTDALAHDVLVVYPEVSANVLSALELAALKRYVRLGGTLVGLQLSDNSLFDVFGLASTDNIASNQEIRDVKFDTENFPLLTSQLDHPFEQRISIYRRLGENDGVLFTNEGPDRTDSLDPEDSGDGVIYGYQVAGANVIARYDNENDDDDTGNEYAAITRHEFGAGVAYSIAWDVGYQGTLGHSLEYAPLGRVYSDAYSPGFDVTMNVFKDIFHKENAAALSLWTVPNGRGFSMIITHDIDAHESGDLVTAYAQLEQDCDVPATYFWQTRYMNDARDMRFLSNDAVRSMEKILSYPVGHELASHSVSHSFSFAKFPIGGDEQFPGYQPRSLLVDNYLELPEHKKYEVAEGSLMGEARVSKYLIEELSGYPVSSFRPGHLALPIRMNEILESTGYKYTSTTTAPYSSTHLPYLSSYRRSTGSVMRKREEQLLDMVEIPLSWEDIGKSTIRKPEHENDPTRLGMMEPEFLRETEDFIEQLSQSGGNFTLLIHPTALGHEQKLAYQFYVLDSFFPGGSLDHTRPYFATIKSFGEWWLARSKVGLDLRMEQQSPILSVTTPMAINGLSIRIPTGWELAHSSNSMRIEGLFLIIDSLAEQSQLDVEFKEVQTSINQLSRIDWTVERNVTDRR